MQLARLGGFPVKVLVSFRNQVRVMGFPASGLLCAQSEGAKGSAALSILLSKESRLHKGTGIGSEQRKGKCKEMGTIVFRNILNLTIVF